MFQYGIVCYRARLRRNRQRPGVRLARILGGGLAGLAMIGWGLWLLRHCHAA